MTINYGNEIFYNTKEVCEAVGIDRSTLFRWLKKGVIKNVNSKDVGSMFTKKDVRKINSLAQKEKLAEQLELFCGGK
jgi:predicted site-specific integrase-resolvase